VLARQRAGRVRSRSAVLSAYRAEWKAFEQAAAIANAADPAPAETMVNPLLDQVRAAGSRIITRG
jgi:hypothetical protein